MELSASTYTKHTNAIMVLRIEGKLFLRRIVILFFFWTLRCQFYWVGRKAHFLMMLACFFLSLFFYLSLETKGSSRERKPPWKRRLLASIGDTSTLQMLCTLPRRDARQLQKMKSHSGSPLRSCCPGISSAEPMPTFTVSAGNWPLCGSLGS